MWSYVLKEYFWFDTLEWSLCDAPGLAEVANEGVFRGKALRVLHHNSLKIIFHDLSRINIGEGVKVLEEDICAIGPIFFDLRPLITILGELDSIVIPGTMEVFWTTLWRGREIYDDAIVRIDPWG